MEYQAWGRLKIRAGLQALQLPDSAIRDAMDAIDKAKYANNLRKLIAQRQKESEDKRLRFLAQRGFTYDEIKSIS